MTAGVTGPSWPDPPGTVASIDFVGDNGEACSRFLDTHAGLPSHERWFVTRGMAASTGGQAWRYVRGAAKWPDSIKAAVYAESLGEWLPVPVGATLALSRAGSVTLGLTVDDGKPFRVHVRLTR